MSGFAWSDDDGLMTAFADNKECLTRAGKIVRATPNNHNRSDDKIRYDGNPAVVAAVAVVATTTHKRNIRKDDNSSRSI